jgi:hypothetical protein
VLALRTGRLPLDFHLPEVEQPPLGRLDLQVQLGRRERFLEVRFLPSRPVVARPELGEALPERRELLLPLLDGERGRRGLRRRGGRLGGKRDGRVPRSLLPREWRGGGEKEDGEGEPSQNRRTPSNSSGAGTPGVVRIVAGTSATADFFPASTFRPDVLRRRADDFVHPTVGRLDGAGEARRGPG